MNGNDTFLDVNNAHLRVTSGNVYASAFNLDQIDIVMSSNTASTVNFNNPTKAFNAASNIEVGTANLFVDTVNSRVGVGTASPATTLDVAGDLNVSGNLTIIGTRTTLDTEHLMVKDPIIELGKGNTTLPGVDLGLILTRPATTSNVGIIFDESESTLEIGYTQGNASDSTITMQSAATEPLSVNVNGTISGNGSGLTALNATNITTGTLDRNTTGSAATLTTPRSIGGVNFDGSADIVPTTFGAATFDTDTLVVDATNDRVGIGTTSPSHALTVAAASGDAEVHIQAQGNDGGDAILYFNGSPTNQRKCAIISSNVAPNSYCKQDLHFCMETTNDLSDVDITDSKMVITNAGNVGIGTTNPDARLHLEEPSAISATTRLFHTENAFAGGSVGHFEIIEEKTGAGTGWGDFTLRLQRRVDVTEQGYIEFNPSGSTGDYGIAFGNSGGGGPGEIMRIVGQSGNVGIGTTDPKTRLHVSHDLHLQSSSEAWNTTAGKGLYLRYSLSDGQDAAYIQSIDRANASLSYPMIFQGSSYQFSVGDVGIGTTTSPGAKLHVVGNIKHEGLTMSSGTDVDQLITIPMTLSFDGSSWYTVTSGSSHLAGGTWIVKVYIHSAGGAGSGQLYDETYSGMFTWYSGVTNSTVVNDIALHNAGHAPNGEVISMRTRRTGAGGVNLILEINSNMNWGGTTRATSFLCRRLL